MKYLQDCDNRITQPEMYDVAVSTKYICARSHERELARSLFEQLGVDFTAQKREHRRSFIVI